MVATWALGCGDPMAGLTGPVSGALPQGVFTEGSHTLAVLPDTQFYSQQLPYLFELQTRWIAAVAHQIDLRYVLHLGDIVNSNSPLEWERAAQAMSFLDGVVPYVVVPGNHDYGPAGDASTRDTLMNHYLGFDKSARQPGFGGAYEWGKLDNTYHLFTAGGRDYIVVALEWAPRNVVLEWADGVMRQHPQRYGILVTHAYLNHNDRRYDHTDPVHPQDFNPHAYRTPGKVNDGEEIWQKLVRHHRFVIALNGHVLGDGTGYLASITDLGNTCHQMLSNYQGRPQGGEAYLRLLEFLPDGISVRVFTYSPLLTTFLTSADQQFEFELD